MTSNGIAQEHDRATGADILSFGGLLLIGMGFMAALMLFSERRADRERSRSD